VQPTPMAWLEVKRGAWNLFSIAMIDIAVTKLFAAIFACQVALLGRKRII